MANTWVCDYCGNAGTGLLYLHHEICPASPHRAGEPETEAQKDATIAALQARLVELEAELRRVHTFKAALEAADKKPVSCPKCSSTEHLVVGEVQDHNLFHYRCRKCYTGYSA